MQFDIQDETMQFDIQDDMKFGINVGCVQPDYIRSNIVRRVVVLTQAEYDALENPDENTLYVISEENGT